MTSKQFNLEKHDFSRPTQPQYRRFTGTATATPTQISTNVLFKAFRIIQKIQWSFEFQPIFGVLYSKNFIIGLIQ